MNNETPPNPNPAPAEPPYFPRAALVRLSRNNCMRKLTLDQLIEVEQWLFVEKISKAEARRRCEERFQIKATEYGMASFCRGVDQQKENQLEISRRLVMADMMMRINSPRPGEFGGTPEQVHGQVQVLLAGRIAKLSVEPDTPENRAKLRENTTMLRAGMRETLRQEKLRFDREKWEFDISEACLKKLPELKVIENSDTIPYKEKIRLIRIKLFGCAPE